MLIGGGGGVKVFFGMFLYIYEPWNFQVTLKQL